MRLRLSQTLPVPLQAELTCAPGELLVLVGPSGSGKTTILRAVAGLVAPADGEITCHGEIWTDTRAKRVLSPQARRVGLVFQDYALFPHLSILNNVTLALGHLPRARRRPRATDLLELVHLSGLEARRPAQLSGGQRQRVALARALAREPRVLLLDEPFSAVDQVTRGKLQREMALLRRQINIPMVLVTHDLEEAVALGDRIVVLHGGHTLQAGPPMDLMTRPDSTLVARLLGIDNVFPARIMAVDAAGGHSLLDWNGLPIAAALNPRFQPGDRVFCVVPPSYILLHRRDRPSRGEAENPVPGRVAELVVLGEKTTVSMQVSHREGFYLRFSVPSHVAKRNRLGRGEAIIVSLLSEGVHLVHD